METRKGVPSFFPLECNASLIYNDLSSLSFPLAILTGFIPDPGSSQPCARIVTKYWVSNHEYYAFLG